jgi:glutaredoxin
MQGITVYTKPDCQQCVQAKEYLKALGLAYEQIDITENDEARNKLIEAKLKSVPQIYLNDALLVGGWHTLKNTSEIDLLKMLDK